MKLFTSLGSAKAWITCWLKGYIKKTWSYDGEFVEYTYIHDPRRTRDKLEIIPVTLEFGKPLA